MLEITWDTTGQPALAVGRGDRYGLAEAPKWVIENAQPMIYEQSDGQFVFVRPTGGIEAWQCVTSQADAAARARRILADDGQATTLRGSRSGADS
jgi:hypothetical protein